MLNKHSPISFKNSSLTKSMLPKVGSICFQCRTEKNSENVLCHAYMLQKAYRVEPVMALYIIVTLCLTVTDQLPKNHPLYLLLS